MELFLTDECQVSFPGSTICGILCVQKLSNLSHKPIISVKGFTRTWKSSTNKETDEYSLFYEDTAKLSPATDNKLYSTLNNKLTTDYSKIFCFHIVLPNNLPPSYEVPFGHTRYKLKAYFNSKKCSKYFSVNQWVGLEKRNDAITTRYRKALNFLPLKHVRIIAEGSRGYIASGASQIWCKHPLYIPAIIPTTETSNNSFNFFDVKYKIKMVVILKNSKKRISLKQKIFIGNKVDVIPYEIMSKSCSIMELEGYNFIPKYIIYETNQE